VPARDLFTAHDPARVAEWCHEHLEPGVLYAAPSAAARQVARRASLGARGVAVGARIVGAGALADTVEARAGLPKLELASPSLSRLLIVAAGEAARVPLFDAAPPPGAVAALGRLIRDLRLNGVSPDAYRAAGGDPRAAAAYAAFESRRTGLGLADEAELLARVTQAMPRLGTVVLEDPVVSSRRQAEFYRALAERADAVFVGVPALAALERPVPAGIPEAAIPGPGSPAGPSAAARAFFRELGFAETRDDARAAGPEIAALCGVGADGEVALVARRILQLIGGGTAPECILGAAPTAGYLSRLHETCARVGVPVASPRRVDAADVPLVRTLLAVFTALADAAEDTAERGLALLGTPYLGLGPRLHDIVHRRLTLAGQGSLRSWKDFARLRDRHPTRRFALSVEETAATLAAPQTPTRYASIVSRLVLDFGFLASARSHYLATGRDAALRADQQAWEAVQEALEEVGRAFERTKRTAVPVGEWLAEVGAALQGETVRVDHRGVRGVHLTVTGGGLPVADHVFAVGWREGVFPRRPREDALLSDAVKERLNAAGARLRLTADRAAHDEERRERIVRAARRSLVVSWPEIASDGSPQLRSFFAEDIGVPAGPAADAPAAAVGETTWPLHLGADRAERLARAAVLVRHQPESRLGGERAQLEETLRGLDATEARALRGERHAPQRIVVPDDLVPRIRKAAANQSASQANALARCLYEHFGEKRLEIAALAAPEIGILERGSVAHSVLADVVRGGGFDPVRAGEAFDRRWAEALPPHLAGDAEAVFEGGMLRAQVLHLVELERDLLAAVPARPALVEFGFGMPAEDAERCDPASLREGIVLPLPSGAPIGSVVLRGAIDRVDVVEESGTRYGVAIDYKSGKAESHGKRFAELADFQLPIYCEAMRAAGVEPVGAVFLGIASGERYGIVREDFADRFLLGPTKGVRRLRAETFGRRLAVAMETLAGWAAKAAAPEVVVAPRDDDCGWCELAPVCRIGTFGVGGGGGDDA
jgi:hypothetical protein